MFYKSLAAVKEYCMSAFRACRIMPVAIASIAFAAFIHAIFTHEL